MNQGNNSFASIVGEFGLYLQEMVGIKAPPHLLGLRRFMLNAYNKSGQFKTIRASIYSDKDKNTGNVLSPAFTLVGESSPERFYEGLNEELMMEGLLPRFTVIEYAGKRVPLNENFLNVAVPTQLIDKLTAICAYSLSLNTQNKIVNITTSERAKELLKKFDKYCDDKINTADKEVTRVIWTRAHVKAMKLAGLIAVGNDPYNPVIDERAAMWAINLVHDNSIDFAVKFENGDVGKHSSESKQHQELSRIANDYLVEEWEKIEKYKAGSKELHAMKVIPYSYLYKRAARVGIFKSSIAGITKAIKETIKSMCERGILIELDKSSTLKKFGTAGLCYVLADNSQ